MGKIILYMTFDGFIILCKSLLAAIALILYIVIMIGLPTAPLALAVDYGVSWIWLWPCYIVWFFLLGLHE